MDIQDAIIAMKAGMRVANTEWKTRGFFDITYKCITYNYYSSKHDDYVFDSYDPDEFIAACPESAKGAFYSF